MHVQSQHFIVQSTFFRYLSRGFSARNRLPFNRPPTTTSIPLKWHLGQKLFSNQNWHMPTNELVGREKDRDAG